LAKLLAGSFARVTRGGQLATTLADDLLVTPLRPGLRRDVADATVRPVNAIAGS
jgi:hypothetical protein